MNIMMLILLCWAFLVPANLAFGDAFATARGPENLSFPQAYWPSKVATGTVRIGHRITNRLERRGAWLHSRLDRHGQRIECRLDRRAEWAQPQGRKALAAHLDRRGYRMHFRWHHRAERFGCRLATSPPQNAGLALPETATAAAPQGKISPLPAIAAGRAG